MKTCAVKNCKGQMELIYLGKMICGTCWDRMANDRAKLRSALGLKPQATSVEHVELSLGQLSNSTVTTGTEVESGTGRGARRAKGTSRRQVQEKDHGALQSRNPGHEPGSDQVQAVRGIRGRRHRPLPFGVHGSNEGSTTLPDVPRKTKKLAKVDAQESTQTSEEDPSK